MTDATVKLLTPALIKKVEAKVESVLELARKEYPTHTFEMPEIRYDVKNTDGGLAYGKKWLIRLNLILCYENEEHFINSTVPHEVAHLVARRVHGFFRKNPDGTDLTCQKTGKLKKVRSHGPEWAEVMKLFSLEPARCHSYDVSSIQKPARSKRGAVVQANDLGLMLRRLQNGIKRLPEVAKEDFQGWLAEHIATNQ